MPGRILQMQRQVRELGRLRTGYTTGNRPVRSKTWILTSKDRDLLVVAAEEWGGTVVEWTPLNSDVKQWSLTTETDALPAFLPPGDPLTQNYEMWNRGGATRRCDGVTESKSGNPCLCRAQFGDEFHKRDIREVCKPYSQLNVMLLGLPDIGVWRHVTKSFYAAGEIAGMVDLIKARVGPEPIVPVWLIIDQREKVADGKKTPYPVPIVKIRGAESGAALLAGNVPTLELGPARERPALESGPAEAAADTPRTAEQFKALANLARDPETIRALWKQAGNAGVLDDGLKAFLTARGQDLGAPAKPNGNGGTPADQVKPTSAPPIEPDADEPDKDMVWMAILNEAGKLRWSAEDLEKRVTARFEKDSSEINGWQMQTFLDELKTGAIQ